MRKGNILTATAMEQTEETFEKELGLECISLDSLS
jgi:hypothetical protein